MIFESQLFYLYVYSKKLQTLSKSIKNFFSSLGLWNRTYKELGSTQPGDGDQRIESVKIINC